MNKKVDFLLRDSIVLLLILVLIPISISQETNKRSIDDDDINIKDYAKEFNFESPFAHSNVDKCPRCEGMTWEEAKIRIDHNTQIFDLDGIIVTNPQPSTDQPLKEAIHQVLSQYRYLHPYETDVFDCSDRSQITHTVLKDYGFNTKIAYAINQSTAPDNNHIAHVWVVVYDDDQHMIAIETTFYDDVLGIIVEKKPTRFQYYAESWQFNDSQELTNAFPHDGGAINTTSLPSARGVWWD